MFAHRPHAIFDHHLYLLFLLYSIRGCAHIRVFIEILRVSGALDQSYPKQMLVTSTTPKPNSRPKSQRPLPTASRWSHSAIVTITCLLSYSIFLRSRFPSVRCMHACSPFFCVPCASSSTTSAYRRHWPMPSALPDARRGGVAFNEVHLPAIRGFQQCFGR